MEPLWRAIRAALFLGIHVALAFLIIGALYFVQLGLIAIGDPKLFDLMPVRYIFDVGIFIAFFGFGSMEAYLLFQEHYRNATVVRGPTDDPK